MYSLHPWGGWEAFLIASEGTIAAGIYEKVFNEYQIPLKNPTDGDQKQIRTFIEVVKQNKIGDPILQEYQRFLEKLPCETILLGCTEIPVLHAACLERGVHCAKKVIDPLQCVINRLQKEFAASLS